MQTSHFSVPTVVMNEIIFAELLQWLPFLSLGCPFLIFLISSFPQNSGLLRPVMVAVEETPCPGHIALGSFIKPESQREAGEDDEQSQDW